MRVLESRPEVTRRRDEGSPSGWLAGSASLSWAAARSARPPPKHAREPAPRRSASSTTAWSRPGSSSARRTNDADVRQPKALSLAVRLARIGAGTAVEGLHVNALDAILGPDAGMSGFDLVIDATADAGVRSAIERKRRVGGRPWPPMVAMVLGHHAACGLVTVSLPGSAGAGCSALRQVALHALASPGEWSDIADDFFRAEARTEMFFPVVLTAGLPYVE
jgi:hypothetical protein